MTDRPLTENEQTDPLAGLRGIAEEREHFNQRLANARIHNSELEQEIARLRGGIEDICQQKATSPITRARLRHLKAGIDWRKAK